MRALGAVNLALPPAPGRRRAPRSAAIFAFLLGVASVEVDAQQDSVVVQAGARYEAGGLHELFLGSGYRDLWTTPIRVPILRPDTFAGGLTVLERGAGLQTASLRFQGGDGRQYVFRSVDKFQDGGLHPDLRNTLVSRIAQDQVSAKHPAAAVVVAPILEAAGVMHASPRIVLLADHPLLGEHRSEFAGMLGIIEERPEDVEDGGGGFGGYERIIGSERLLERLEESPEDRVEASAYLRARLVDLLVGDWDRHPDQWRWAEDERDGRRIWMPIPRDRDNAFSDVSGIVATVAGALRPSVASFGAEYPDLYGMVHNAQVLDRQILPLLEWDEWRAVADEVTARITDRVIDDAVAALPPAYLELNGSTLAATLRARRDALPAAAREMYDLLASEVDVYATDENDFARIEHLASGALEVSVLEGSAEGAVYFDRTFLPEETREVRLHLRGGDDVVSVREASGARVKTRILGGGGDDVVTAAVGAGGAERTLVFDDRGENRIESDRPLHVDDRPYDLQVAASITENNAPPPRDWGRTRSMLAPTAGWVSSIGPVIGAGPSWTRYGFRRDPYASKASVALLYAPLYTRFGVEAESRYLRTGGGGETRVRARATNISVTNFHGYGNETPGGEDGSLKRVWVAELGGEIELERELGARLTAHVGPIVRLVEPSPAPGGPAALLGPPGTDGFAVGGLGLSAHYDGRDSIAYPRQGFRLRVGGEGYPLVRGDAPEAFATGRATAFVYLPVPFPVETTLALRAGAERVWGDAPLQYAAMLGGGSTLRGYRSQRFAGDRAVFSGAELRIAVGRANLLVARGDLGVIALADAGRVWWANEQSDAWHTGFGGGFWFAPFERSVAAHVVYGYGESHTLSAGIGMPF